MTMSDHSQSAERIHHLESEVRELRFLHETSQLLTATLDPDSVLRSLMTQVRDFFDVEAVSVALLDEECEELTFRVAVGEASEAVTGLRVPVDKGIAGWVAREGKPVCMSDVSEDSRFYSGIDEQTGFRTKAVLAVPIKRKDRTIGAIEVINPADGTFDERSLRVLGRVADQAALAIYNADLYERARRAELRYERLFHSSPVPVVVMDFDSEILDVNQRTIDLTGRPEDELIGSRLCDLLVGEQSPCEAMFDDLLQDGEASTEMKIPSPSGIRTIRAHMTAIDYGGRRAIQWIGHDITELAELERMRDDLMHMIVHDLQNPLSNIVGSLQMMEQALREQDGELPMMDVLQVAMRSSSRLERLISSLLDLRQLEEGKADLDKVLVSPGVLAREAIELVQPVMDKKRQGLTGDIPPGLPAVSVDRDMITRVLTNLLDNAAKFTQTTGRIALEIWEEEEDVLFRISDNGPGISSDARGRIFERFARLERTRRTKGTGLGLPFCKLAVEAHGGEIWVESTLGEGSQFTFALPLEGE